MHPQFIHFFASNNSNIQIYVTMVYGGYDNIERNELWEALWGISSSINDPCVIRGDFNLLKVKGK